MAEPSGPRSRLTPLPRQALDAAGEAVWDKVTGTRGADLVGPDGALVGPFDTWVHAPGIGIHLAALGAELRFATSIPRRLSEVAIITVGARYRAEFEWWAHARMAREHGVAAEVVDAIGDGSPPPWTADDERVVHTAARQLAETGHLDDDAYAEAVALLGETGVVELVSLCGYYALVCLTLNAFRVPLPAGATPRWGGGA